MRDYLEGWKDERECEIPPIRKAVEVENGDTPEILQHRVMEQAEWKILPKAIDLIANGRVKVEGRSRI